MSVTSPQGFQAAGIACGIKASGDADLALVVTTDHRPVDAAATFTANKATAAPVLTTRAHLAATGGRAAAVILNSGNANASTGTAGQAASERMCQLVADELSCRADEVLVCSTGLIGIPLLMAPIEGGVGRLVSALAGDGGAAAARAIMTTDTRQKEVEVTRHGWTIGGMAKGAAMLAPNMATMLAVLTTDAAVGSAVLQRYLREAVADSFNAITVDGCTSTNDTVIVLASGATGPPRDLAAFGEGLAAACADLAGQMVGDAEGATKVVRLTVSGALTDREAAVAARRVAESQLVKCSLYGEDPYWGRVVSELGSAGVAFDPDRVSVAYGPVTVAVGGVACPHDVDGLRTHMAGRAIDLHADLGLGGGRAVVLTNDLTHAYIDENMRTS